VVALNASSIVFLSTDNALHLESLDVNLAHAHWGLWSDRGAWDPHGAAQVHPLVQ